MTLACRYVSDQPRDNRIAVLDHCGNEYIVRVLGCPNEQCPEIELVNENIFVPHELWNRITTEALKFHFGIQSTGG